MFFENEYMLPSNLSSSLNYLDSISKSSQDYQLERATSGSSTFPKELKLNIAFGVDKSIKEVLGSEDAVENWVASVMCDMQTFYIHPSLKTKILLEVRSSFCCMSDYLYK